MSLTRFRYLFATPSGFHVHGCIKAKRSVEDRQSASLFLGYQGQPEGL